MEEQYESKQATEESLALFKSLLNKEFYEENKTRLSKDLFPKSTQDIYDTLIVAHDKYKEVDSISVKELWSLYKSENPALTESKRAEMYGVMSSLMKTDSYNNEVAKEVLQRQWSQKKIFDVATDCLELSNTTLKNKDTLESMIETLESIRDGYSFNNNKFLEHISTDVGNIFEKLEESYQWKFNFDPLQDTIKGIGGGVLGIMAARPDCGKTFFHLSFTFGKGGFLEQGAKVHMICNEEPARRVLVRGLAALTGMTVEEMKESKEEVQKSFDKIRDNLFIVEDEDAIGITLEDLDNYIDNNDVDILVLDQADKIAMTNSYNNDASKFKDLYSSLRQIAKKRNIAILAISQASDLATGKLYYGYEALENSRTGKAGEADFILCVGMHSISNDNNYDDGYRMINIAKFKGGSKRPIQCSFDFAKNRIVEI